tara:strand:- start:314 stop:637 length:324 start_codon:yes stop_codon:yes gene_type:complete
MAYDHDAIIKAYPDIFAKSGAKIDDDTGVFDSFGNPVTIDQSKVDAARVELNKLAYQGQRQFSGETIYADWREQLEMLYDDMIAGKLDATGTWATHIKSVKDANPKP